MYRICKHVVWWTGISLESKRLSQHVVVAVVLTVVVTRGWPIHRKQHRLEARRCSLYSVTCVAVHKLGLTIPIFNMVIMCDEEYIYTTFLSSSGWPNNLSTDIYIHYQTQKILQNLLQTYCKKKRNLPLPVRSFGSLWRESLKDGGRLYIFLEVSFISLAKSDDRGDRCPTALGVTTKTTYS